MNEKEWTEKVNKEAEALMEYCKGKDFRFLVPAMTATIEYYLQQMPDLKPYVLEQIEFLKDRIK